MTEPAEKTHTDMMGRGLVIAARIGAFRIRTADEAQLAADFRKSAKDYEKQVKAHFAPHKARAKAVLDGLKDDEGKHLAIAEDAIAAVDAKLLAWQTAEQARLADELKRAEEVARNLAESAVLETATALECEQKSAEAEAVLAAPVTPVFLTVNDETKLDGVSFTTKYSGIVEDRASFLRSVVSLSLWELAEEVQGKLNKFIDSNGGRVSLGGVRIVKETKARGVRRADAPEQGPDWEPNR